MSELFIFISCSLSFHLSTWDEFLYLCFQKSTLEPSSAAVTEDGSFTSLHSDSASEMTWLGQKTEKVFSYQSFQEPVAILSAELNAVNGCSF